MDYKSTTELVAEHPNLAEYIAQIEQELMTAKLLLSTRVEATRLNDAERRFQYQKDENDNRIKQIRKLQAEEREAQRCFGMALELNLELQNKADMWRDEFERIKALCYGKSLEFLEIQGICERAMLDIRSKISLIDQREKVAEANAELRRELRVISDYYGTLRAEMVDREARDLYGGFQAAACYKDMNTCRVIASDRLRCKCLWCESRGEVGGQLPDGSHQTDQCQHCEGNGFVEIPDLAWLNQGKIQFNLLPKDHPDYDPTVE
jgi:hypothetical protein